MRNLVLPIGLSMLISLASGTNLHAASPTKPTDMQFGSQDITSAEIKNIHHSGKLLVKKIKVLEATLVNGRLEADDAIFLGDTTINGRLDAKEAKFKGLVVNGDAELKKVQISGPVNVNGKLELEECQLADSLHVYGYLKAKDAAFAKMVTVNSSKATFEDSVLNGLTVQKNDSKEPQVIELKKTKINGNIVFESGNGIVNMDSDSALSGEVKGGTVKK